MSLRWTSGAGAREVVSGLGDGGARPDAGPRVPQVPEGDAGSTAWAQVPEGSAGPSAGRCPDLSSPGPPIFSAAPDLGSPRGVTCGLASQRGVQRPRRAVPAVKESCVTGADCAWTPRAGNLGAGCWGGGSQDPRHRPPGPCACPGARCSLRCCYC